MSAFTLRYRAIPDDAEYGVAQAIARADGAAISLQRNAEPVCAYGLLEGASAACRSALQKETLAEVLESAVIALAVFPHAAEALPLLEVAAGGPGAPAGMVRCQRIGGGLLLEWDMERSPASLVLAVLDVELARIRSGRRTHVLAPLPLRWWTAIAAQGLQAPEIAPDRVLEALLEAHHVPR